MRRPEWWPQAPFRQGRERRKASYVQRGLCCGCIVPVDGFFEWRAIKGARAKQPYAIAMKDGSPFGLAGLWENWKNPNTGEWERTFAIVTVPSNELVAQIHDRMPATSGRRATSGGWVPNPIRAISSSLIHLSR